MTKVIKKEVLCLNCNNTSEQLIVYSVNFALGSKESNEKLSNHQQKCPHCGYENKDISKKEYTSSN